MLERIGILKYIGHAALLLCLMAGINAPRLSAATISGKAPDYAGQELLLYTESDAIIPRLIELASDTVDADGSFLLSFDCDSTLFCKCDLGFYRGCIFVESNKNYKINLPPYKPLTESENLNPYFVPETILLSIDNPDNDDINLLVASFEDKLDSLWNRLLFNYGTTEDFDRFYGDIESAYRNCGNGYFNDYRKFSYAQLLRYFGDRGRDMAISMFLLPGTPGYSNPAFWAAFSSLLEDFRFIEYLKPNRELYELAAILNVANGHLGENYLDSVSIDRPRKIAAALKQELRKTAEGNDVGIPYLINLANDTLRWTDFHEPYIYLCFANSGLKESLSDLDFAGRLKARWKRNFAFVFVFMSDCKEKISAACSNYPQIEYICSSEDNPGIEKAFGLKTPPAYFVITNTGKFEISPAPAPAYFEP